MRAKIMVWRRKRLKRLKRLKGLNAFTLSSLPPPA